MKRHGLVSFWLFFIMLRSLRDGYFFIAPYQLTEANEIILKLIVAANVLTIASIWLLYAWKRSGFWLFLGVQIAGAPLCLSAGIGIFQSLLGVISAGILFLLLQIPKDGYSSWDYLSDKNIVEELEARKEKEESANRRCRQCGSIYTKDYNSCPRCGSSLYEDTYKTNDKRCRMCSTVYNGSNSECPQCGSYLYEEIK